MTTNTTAAQPLDLDSLCANLDKLSAAIMNLPCKMGRAIEMNGASAQVYKEGHRDARHAAIELVNEQVALIAQARAARLDTTASASGQKCATCFGRGHTDAGDPETGATKDDYLCADCVGTGRAAQPVQTSVDVEKPEAWKHRTQFTWDEVQEVVRASLAPVAAQPDLLVLNDDGVEWPIKRRADGKWEFCENRFGGKPSIAAQQAAAKAPAAQAVTVPEGFAIVPIDPPLAMAKAFRDHDTNGDRFLDGYAAMLAASPASTPEASQQAAAVAAPSGRRKILMPQGMIDVTPDTAPSAGAATTSEDAQRYLWLRNKANSAVGKAPMVFNCSADEHLGWDQSLWGQSLDDALDIAMRATQQEGE